VALAAARRARDVRATAAAQRARGLALRELGRLREAASALRASARTADRAGLPAAAAEARVSLVSVLYALGRPGDALRESDRAAASLSGTALGRLRSNRALLLEELGETDLALDEYGRAIRIATRAGDAFLEACVRLNRGILATFRASPAAARRDLEQAAAMAEANDWPQVAARARHNLGFLAAHEGDVPAALARFDQAEDTYRQIGLRTAEAQVALNRSEVLLSVRLIPEARGEAEAAAEQLRRVGAHAEHAQALLVVCQAALLDDDPVTALDAARQAERGFARQRRPGRRALAMLAAARAGWQASDPAPANLRRARRAAADLGALGLDAHLQEAQVLAAQIALDSGRRRLAERYLREASRAVRSGSAAQRVDAWYAEAMLRLDRGDRRGARAALLAGVRVVDRTRAVLGASDLRAHVGGLSQRLTRAGLRIAREESDAHELLAWAERGRAGALRAPPVRPPRDAALAADLAALRRMADAIERTDIDGGNGAALRRERKGLEEAVRRRTRRAAGARDATGIGGPASIRELRAALGERTLVELVEIDDELIAVTVGPHGAQVANLGSLVAAAGELESVRFAIRRLALARGSEQSLQAAGLAAREGAACLDAMVLGPVRAWLGDAAIVVVPTGPLHAIPWGILPTCRGRPVVVAPSATTWLRADAALATEPRFQALFVAGPGLPGAEEEVRSLARTRGARRLTGRRALTSAVLAGLEGVEVAHLAAHGTFRSDNPLFSALTMADGPLTAYDLEGVRAAPSTLILSACDGGLSAVRPGDELLGLAAALLPLGTRTIVASVGLAPDHATRPLMVDLHRRLRQGARPAVALAAAIGAVDEPDDAAGSAAALAARAAFVCLGAG
jgi:CHAT domain